MVKSRYQFFSFLLCALECALTSLSFLLAGLIRYGSSKLFGIQTRVPEVLVVLCFITIAFYYLLSVQEGMLKRGLLVELGKVVQYNLAIFASITVYSFCTKNSFEFSRLTLFLCASINTFLQYGFHLLIKKVLRVRARRRPEEQDKLLAITFQRYASELYGRLTSQEKKELVGFVLLDKQEDDVPDIEGVPVVGNAKSCLNYAVNHVVDVALLFVKHGDADEKQVRRILHDLEQMGILVNYYIEMMDFGVSEAKQINRMGDFYVIGFSSRLFDYRMLLLKRLMDIVGSLAGLLITVLVGIFVVPAILIESGRPVFFVQQRIGRNGRIFKIYKFRSMYQDAEKRKRELMAENEMEGPLFKLHNDPRITRVGRILRKTSLDELPQFWNVLRGDMSLVGIRPPTVEEYQQYNYVQKRRVSFKSGITGLWQISGRNNITNFDDVVKLDFQYIDNWSIAMDIKILLKTVKAVLTGNGAV